jgi:GGDEF domain-containing protein
MNVGRPPSHRRPRPVADAPAADPVLVAKGWLLELLAAAPLEAVASVPTADLAREAPGLCAAVLEAVGSDAALDRLSPGGDRAALAARAGALAGARSAPDAVAAVEALRAALTQALRPAGAADPALAADLGDRLAHVCSLVAAAALAPGALERAARAGAPEPGAARDVPAPAGGPGAAEAGGAEPAADALENAAPASAAPGAAAPEGVVRLDPFARAGAAQPPAEQAAAPWATAITRRLERYAEDGRPFAVLAVEVDEVDRLEAVDAAGGFAKALEAAEAALEAELRPADMLVRERAGRHWLIAPDTSAAAARELGERLAAAVAGRAFHHGVPLSVSIGLAICPDDGTSTDTLLGHADGGVFAARAAGLPVA